MTKKKEKKKELIISLLKVPIVIVAIFIFLLLGKHILKIEFGSLKKIGPDSVEFFEPEKKDQLKDTVKKEEKDDTKPDRPRNDFIRKATIEEFRLDSKVTDYNGNPISGVEIWCDNCLSKQRIKTDENGFFSLKDSYVIKDSINFQLRICFEYKAQKDCKNSQYKYVSNLKPPNFFRND